MNSHCKKLIILDLLQHCLICIQSALQAEYKKLNTKSSFKDEFPSSFCVFTLICDPSESNPSLDFSHSSLANVTQACDLHANISRKSSFFIPPWSHCFHLMFYINRITYSNNLLLKPEMDVSIAFLFHVTMKMRKYKIFELLPQ